MSKYEIIIVGDTNDADYVTKISTITEKQLNEIKPLIAAIKKFKPYNGKSESGYESTHDNNYPYGNGEYIPREDLGEKRPEEIYPQFTRQTHDLFQNFCPYGEDGIHTIESITIQPATKKTKLL